LSGFFSGERGKNSLAGDRVHLVDRVQDQAEDAFLLKQVLTIAKSFEVFLTLLVTLVNNHVSLFRNNG
jgi:hypothetical protein